MTLVVVVFYLQDYLVLHRGEGEALVIILCFYNELPKGENCISMKVVESLKRLGLGTQVHGRPLLV